MAGRQGFEPQEAFTSTVFKTAAFDRSAISRLRAGRPRRKFAQIKIYTWNLFGFFSDPLGAIVNLFFGPLSRVVRILFYAVPSIRAPTKNHQCQKSRQYVSHNNSFFRIWRRHPDSNRGSKLCRLMPYHLAMSPRRLIRWCPEPDLNRHGKNSEGF